MKRNGFLSLALVATCAAACSSNKGKVVGQEKTSERAGPAANVPADMVSRDASDFTHHVAIVNVAEIELGKLAAERGTADAVKKFGRMMVADHEAAGDKLRAVAADLKIDVPDRPDDQLTEQRDRLARRSGADFDRDYASAMVDGHKDLLDQLEPRIDKKSLEQWKVATSDKTGAAASIATLPDKSDNPTTMRINQLAADLYPTVRAHWDAAKALESSLKK
jgi:putative membrane protein